MRLVSRRTPPRVPHHEPGFSQPDFVAEYGEQTARFPVEFEPILKFLDGRLDLAAPREVLEIGPGPGWMAILLAKKHPLARVTGVDLSEAFVALANENSRREGLADRVAFTAGDAATLARFPDQSFDAVMSNQCLHYWERPEQVFNQIARVLKPGGAFCISDDRRDMDWRGRLQVLWGRCLLSRRIGASWARSISGCLTTAEATEALARSQLGERAEIVTNRRTMLIRNAVRA
jgi:SAM-dependent methyltransferase